MHDAPIDPRLQAALEDLDLAAWRAGRGAPGERRRALADAARLETLADTLTPEDAEVLRAQAAWVRAQADAAGRRDRGRLAWGTGSGIGGLAATVMGVLMLQAAWLLSERVLDLSPPPVRVERVDPPRVVFVEVPSQPLEGDPAPGTPPPEATPTPVAEPLLAPPQPELAVDAPPQDTVAPGTGGETGVDADRKAGEPTAKRVGLVIRTEDFVPETTTPSKPSVPAAAPDTVMLPAPSEQPGPPSAPPAPARLPSGSSQGYRALAKDFELELVTIGAGGDDRDARGRGALFQVSVHEVTQAQWNVVMGMDLGSISGHWDHPAEALSWCDAIRFANKLSALEGFRPAYRIDGRCENGGLVRWDTQADGFRLLSEQEWLGLAQSSRPGAPPSADPAGRENNRGLGPVSHGGDQRDHGLVGVADNAREWVWGGHAGEPAVPTERYQTGVGDRAVVQGCGPFGGVEPTTESPWCRAVLAPAHVPLGAGVRLARGRTPRQGGS